MVQYEQTVNEAARGERLRHGPPPARSHSKEHVIYRPHPPSHSLVSLCYAPTDETLAEFVNKQLQSNVHYKDNQGTRATLVGAVCRNIIRCPTASFPVIKLNTHLVCFRDGVVLDDDSGSMTFHLYETVPPDVAKLATSNAFQDRDYDRDTARAVLDAVTYRTARNAAAQAGEAAAASAAGGVPDMLTLRARLRAFFDDKEQRLKITG